jgi:hypothetical protein
MEYLTPTDRRDTTFDSQEQLARDIVRWAWLAIEPKLVSLIAGFLQHGLTPVRFLEFELALLGCVREFGKRLLDATLNRLEPDDPQDQLGDLWFECSGYRLRREKTRNRYVATLFGTITLWRRGYRSNDRTDRTIFPLEMMLGLIHGVTPALADRLGKQLAEAGASQGRVLAMLREEYGVSMGAERLRDISRAVSIGMEQFRQSCQIDALLSALKQAQESSGSRKPVLAAGRDGITLREYHMSWFEVATAATISVYDRRGKRLTTIYLAWPPELGQATMSRMLTELLRELLTRWEGPLPQLAYVADSGGNESTYYEDALRHMLHPRTGQKLAWQRVVDYYHVAERIWAMADCLFGKGTRQGTAWARRMLKAIKKPSGPSRVLHSAASLLRRRKLSKLKIESFWKAYRYIQKRTRFLHYHEYGKKHIPLGSGVTEAACKTIYTQRLKLSGMRWTQAGAKTILNLRVILLSRTWDANFRSYLESINPVSLRPYAPRNVATHKMAA